MKNYRKKRNYIPWAIGVAVIALVAWGIAANNSNGLATAGMLGDKIEIQGQEHIAVGATHPGYNSNPPTSGWHYAEAAEWGVHDKELPDEQLVHNLEHGGIWISYKDLDAEARSKLEALARKYPRSVVLAPRAANDAPIALASWGRLQKLQSFDEVAMEAFIKANKNNSPEPLAR